MAEKKIKAPDAALEAARKKIYKNKVKIAKEQGNKLGIVYTDKLNSYLNTYFNNFSSSVEENKFAYNVLNKEWKVFCRKANLSQKYIDLRPLAFEVEVARIVKENKQFQIK